MYWDSNVDKLIEGIVQLSLGILVQLARVFKLGYKSHDVRHANDTKRM